MAYNKFITTDGLVLLDLTADTVTANKLPKGITAHDRSGTPIIGTAEVTGGGGILAQPQLYPVTISRDGDTLIIVDNSENGLFVTAYALYVNGEFIKEYPIHTSDVFLGTWTFKEYVDFKTLVNRGISFNESVTFYSSGGTEYSSVKGPYIENGIYRMTFYGKAGAHTNHCLGTCGTEYIQTSGDKVHTQELTYVIKTKQEPSTNFFEWFCNSAVCATTNIDLSSLELEAGAYEIQVKAKGTNFIDSELSAVETWNSIAGASEVPVTMSAASSYGSVSSVIYNDTTYEGADGETFTAYAGTELYIFNNTGSVTIYVYVNGVEVGYSGVGADYVFVIPTDATSISIQTGETTYITYTTA